MFFQGYLVEKDTQRTRTVQQHLFHGLLFFCLSLTHLLLLLHLRKSSPFTALLQYYVHKYVLCFFPCIITAIFKKAVWSRDPPRKEGGEGLGVQRRPRDQRPFLSLNFHYHLKTHCTYQDMNWEISPREKYPTFIIVSIC